jgi:uncharacterized membrane protein HdeD (DUF308 family)
METDDKSFSNALTSRWWTWVLRGIAAIIFGVLTFVAPKVSLLALVYLWGAYAVADGAFALLVAAQRGRAGLRWGWMLFEGLVGIAAGVATLIWPGITAIALLVVIAVRSMMLGGLEIATAIELRRVIRGEWLLAASGVVSILFGLVLIASPSVGALAMLWLIGGHAILFGALLIAIGVRLRSWRHGHGQQPSTRGASPA